MKIGFIGGYGHHYLRNLCQQPDGEMYSFAISGDGHDATAALSFAQKIEGAIWFETPAHLLDTFQPDVVSIGGIYGYNGDIAALALERDIAVVSDKPIAATWEQLERLHDLTSSTPRVLLTELPFRCQSEFRAACAAVQGGRIGEIVLATAQKSYRFGTSRPAWYAERETYGGTMLWVASHAIDAIHFCSGEDYGRVIGVQGNLSRPDYGVMEDHCIALFELGNGGHAMAHADYLRPAGAATHGDDRLRIAGTRGIVEVRDHRCRLMTDNDPEEDITDSATSRPVHKELLAAIRGDSQEFYSTTQSLALADVLLRARDAADLKGWL